MACPIFERPLGTDPKLGTDPPLRLFALLIYDPPLDPPLGTGQMFELPAALQPQSVIRRYLTCPQKSGEGLEVWSEITAPRLCSRKK
jgi:hypothetical protein